MKRSWMATAAEYSGLAFLLPVATLVGYGIGYALDRLFGTNFLYIVFLVLGILAGFVKVIQQVQKDTRDNGPE